MLEICPEIFTGEIICLGFPLKNWNKKKRKEIDEIAIVNIGKCQGFNDGICAFSVI